MRFGGFVPQGWRLDMVGVPAGYAQYELMRDVALKLERLEFESLWLYDHFHTVPVSVQEPTFECFTACTALAAVTSRIRIGQMVACNMYRPPALLAKMASCLDVVSNGRLDFGLGAGWYEHEMIAYGYGWPKASDRLHMLDEALTLIRDMWTKDHAQLDGRYYKVGVGEAHNQGGKLQTLEGVVNQPKPIQRPHPPIWVGGGGEQLTLKIVARHANYSNFGNSPDEFRKKNQILDEHCAKLGRDPAEITRTACVNVLIGSRAEMERRLRTHVPESTMKRFEAMYMSGSVQQIIDRLAAYKEAGTQMLLVYFPDAAFGDSIERFAADVMPALR